MLEMYLTAIKDPKLIFICFTAGIVTLLTANTVVSRPVAVITKRVATANTLHNIFFMLTRFANFFYVPLIATFVDRAVKTDSLSLLNVQLRLVVWGSFLGAVALWFLLPSFIQLLSKGVWSFERRGSMVNTFLSAVNPVNFGKILNCLRRPTNFNVSLFNLEGVPVGFLIFNVIGTAIWTIGVLCALYVSAKYPQYEVTATLLSGLVNSVAAIIFSTLVDPKASLITDQIVAGERPEKHAYIIAVFLAAGNVLGMIISQFLFIPGAKVIEFATLKLTHGIGGSLIIIVTLSVLVAALSSTAVVSRISAVITRRVATAIAIYNLFFLITRLAQQIYAPIIGILRDAAVKNNSIFALEGQFRWVIAGASIGILIGWLLMPTFIQIYIKAIRGMEKHGSLPKLMGLSIMPWNWIYWIRCIRGPSFLGVKLKDINQIPKPFLYSNIIVVSIHTVGVLAATFASALRPEFARQAATLSGVVNGVATILLGIIVDPIASLITDQAVAGQRPHNHVKIMAVFLIAGMFLGTILSQLIFMPCVYIIKWCSEIITILF